MDAKEVPRYLHITNDRCFKHLIYHVPEVLSIIYQALTGLYSSTFTFQNIEILSQHYDGKLTKRDIFVQDEHHHYINLEMQNGPLTNELCERMQFYCNQLIQLQAKKGSSYHFKTPYVICIVNDDNDPATQLVEYYKARNDKCIEISKNMTNIIFIHLSYINKIREQKPLSQFNSFERILYALKNNFSRDILELEDEVILKMEQTQQNYITLPGGLLTDEQWEWWNERENYFRELRLKESELRLKEKEMELEKMEERFIQFVMNERQFSYQQASDFIKSYSPKKKTGLLQKLLKHIKKG